MNSVIVLGNGESRSSVSLSMLKTQLPIIGCNAVYRDITVDHLICCDQRMVVESLRSETTKDTLVYIRPRFHVQFKKIQKHKNVRILPNVPTTGEEKKHDPTHWGSGPYAVLLAATLEYKNIIMLGFDLYGNKEKVNNVYKNTVNYSPGDTRAVDPSYWIYQIQQVFLAFPETTFKIINYQDWVMPKEWVTPNVSFESVSSFKNNLDKLTLP